MLITHPELPLFKGPHSSHRAGRAEQRLRSCLTDQSLQSLSSALSKIPDVQNQAGAPVICYVPHTLPFLPP